MPEYPIKTRILLRKLQALRDLLAAGWTWGAMARDASGAECKVDSDKAVTFCLEGGMCRLQLGPFNYRPDSVRSRLAQEARLALSTFNDISSKEEVLALCDRAIERARAEAAS